VPSLIPVDYDPFNPEQSRRKPELVPVDYDPFAQVQSPNAPRLEAVSRDPFASEQPVPEQLPQGPSQQALPQLAPPPLEQYAQGVSGTFPTSPSQIMEQFQNVVAEPFSRLPYSTGANVYRQFTDYAKQGLEQVQQPGFHNLVAGLGKGALGELGAIPAAAPYIAKDFGLAAMEALGRMGEATGYGVGPFEGAHPGVFESLSSAPKVRAAPQELPGKPVGGQISPPSLPIPQEPALARPEPAQPVLPSPGAVPPLETAHDLGAAVRPAPVKMTPKGIAEVEGELHKAIVSKPQAFLEEERQYLAGIQPFENHPVVAEELDRAYQRGDISKLSPDAAAYHKIIEPKKKEFENKLAQLQERKRNNKGYDEEDAADLGIDVTGVPRMRLDKSRFISSALEGSPLTSGALSDATSLHGTKYDVLEKADGQRFVVAKGPKTLHILDNKQILPKPDELAYGDTVTHKGEKYLFRRAYDDEIEAAIHRQEGGVGTPPELYLKDPGIKYSYGLASLKTAEARMDVLDKLKSSLESADFIMPSSLGKRKGWVPSEFPGLRNYYVHPRMKEVLEDFTARKRGGKTWENVKDASHWLTSTIFLTGGLLHFLNVGVHSGMAAGWRAFDPRFFSRDWINAWKDVSRGSKLYQDTLKKGGPLFFANFRNADFASRFTEKFGHEIRRDPAGTGVTDMAKRLGIGTKELVDSTARNMSASLWFGGDIIAMQHIRRLMARGYSLDDALLKIKDIPDYRVPSRVWEGPLGREVTEVLRFTPLNVFGRYHYNIAHGYSRLVKEAATGTKEQRIDAAGRAAALTAMYAAYKYRDSLLEEEPKNKYGTGKYEPVYHGPLSVAHIAEGWMTGENRNFSEAMRALGLSQSPLASLGVGLASGTDFAGRPVVRPGASPLEATTQRLDFATQAISPIQQLLGGGEDQSMFEPWERMMAGVRLRPPTGGWGGIRPGQRNVGPIESAVTGEKWGSKPKKKKH